MRRERSAVLRSLSGALLLVLLPMGLLLLVGLQLPGCARGPQGPNIVLIVLDTVREDFTGGGDGTSFTPHLDRLAAEGTLFHHVWSNAPWTVPSHASIFTGLLPSQHGCTSRRPRLPEELPTLAGRLAAAGWQTAAFYSNPWLSDRATGLLRGFAVKDETPLPGFFGGDKRYPDGDQGGKAVVASVQRWLRERSTGRPFFLFVNLLEAHLPYDPPADYRRRELADLSPDDWVSVNWGHEYNAGRHPDAFVDWAKVRRLYGGDVNTADGLLGKLLEALRQEGVDGGTAIVVTSDHGELLGEHHLIEHQFSVCETLLRVPLVIRAPDRLAPGVREDPAMLADLYPTILALAGLPAGEPAEETESAWRTRSLLAPPDQQERSLVAEYAGPPDGLLRLLQRINPQLDVTPLASAYRTLRLGDLRVTVGSDGSVRLHDLAADPGQEHDIAVDRPGELVQLRRRLDRLSDPAGLRGPSSVEMDTATRERLRSLGYVQ
jgi:arylsulfatase A-like enzyme